VLLAVVGCCCGPSARAQALRFARAHAYERARPEGRRSRLHGLRAATAVALCATPVALGFALPVGVLLHGVWREVTYGKFGLPWARFAGWATTSLQLALLAALAAVVLALLLGFLLRTRPGGLDAPLAAARTSRSATQCPGR
jgi:iron(III) transport system permease protein